METQWLKQQLGREKCVLRGGDKTLRLEVIGQVVWKTLGESGAVVQAAGFCVLSGAKNGSPLLVSRLKTRRFVCMHVGFVVDSTDRLLTFEVRFFSLWRRNLRGWKEVFIGAPCTLVISLVYAVRYNPH